MNRKGPEALRARRNGAVILLSVAAGMALLVAAFSHFDGPAARCEGRGGHMLVGPGGETSCISPQTFLPVEAFSPAQTE